MQKIHTVMHTDSTNHLVSSAVIKQAYDELSDCYHWKIVKTKLKQCAQFHNNYYRADTFPSMMQLGNHHFEVLQICDAHSSVMSLRSAA